MLYHSTTRPLSGKIRIEGKNNSFGFFCSPIKQYSKVYGDYTYKVKLKTTSKILILKDRDVFKNPFFNITKKEFEQYIKKYDIIEWYRKEKLTEVIILNPEIVKSYEPI